jgi:hypothetical protein
LTAPATGSRLSLLQKNQQQAWLDYSYVYSLTCPRRRRKKNKEDFSYRGNGHLPCKRSSWAYFCKISLQRFNIELSARRVMTILSFDDEDDGSLIKEYLSKVSKHILENSSRNRRAESISNIRNIK